MFRSGLLINLMKLLTRMEAHEGSWRFWLESSTAMDVGLTVDSPQVAVKALQQTLLGIEAGQLTLDALYPATSQVAGYSRSRAESMRRSSARGVIGRFGRDPILSLDRLLLKRSHAARSYPTAISTRSLMMSWIS